MRLVIPSLMYGDYLATTLPRWLAILPASALRVVTSPEDRETQAVATRCGVAWLATPAWRRAGAVLNKARALDEAFGFAGGRARPSDGEICLALDADVVPFGPFPRDEEITEDTLYGCARYHCPTPHLLEQHLAGAVPRAAFAIIAPGQRKAAGPPLLADTAANVWACGVRALGYFQLFRWRRGIAFGSSQSASRYDLDFHRHFARRVALQDFYVLHLGAQDRRNWRGRVLPRWGDEHER